MSFYDEEGCCLTCEKAEPGCLCYDCRCRKCDDYESDEEGGGHCAIPRGSSWLSWQAYELQAKQKQKVAVERFKDTSTRLSALFSNGRVDRRIYYATALDIPSRIHVDLTAEEKKRFSLTWKSATVLLKNVAEA